MAEPVKKPVPLKRKLVVLEEGTLTSMALNPKIAGAFPILAPIAALARQAPRAGCGSCGRAGQARAETFTKVKRAIAGMDSTKKRQLKDLLNAQQVQIMYKLPNGKQDNLKF